MGKWDQNENEHSAKVGNLSCIQSDLSMNFVHINYLDLRGTQDNSRHFNDITYIRLATNNEIPTWASKTNERTI